LSQPLPSTPSPLKVLKTALYETHFYHGLTQS
jgi:hypothetical protein